MYYFKKLIIACVLYVDPRGVREQLCGLSSRLAFHGFWRLNTGCQGYLINTFT